MEWIKNHLAVHLQGAEPIPCLRSPVGRSRLLNGESIRIMLGKCLQQCPWQYLARPRFQTACYLLNVRRTSFPKQTLSTTETFFMRRPNVPLPEMMSFKNPKQSLAFQTRPLSVLPPSISPVDKNSLPLNMVNIKFHPFWELWPQSP